MINTIGPVWDANETWLVLAAGAMFAAFPLWYATAFSAYYLPLLVILGALIVRGLAFEFRGKRRCPVAAPVGPLHRIRLDRRPVSLGDVLCESGGWHADQRRGRLRRRFSTSSRRTPSSAVWPCSRCSSPTERSSSR